MEYGMTFVFDMYDFERGEEMHLLVMPGDYRRMKKWAGENMADGDENDDENVVDLLQNYATAWFALKRRGRLSELGLPDELTVAGVESMMDRFSLFVNRMRDDLLPLTTERAI